MKEPTLHIDDMGRRSVAREIVDAHPITTTDDILQLCDPQLRALIELLCRRRWGRLPDSTIGSP